VVLVATGAAAGASAILQRQPRRLLAGKKSLAHQTLCRRTAALTASDFHGMKEGLSRCLHDPMAYSWLVRRGLLGATAILVIKAYCATLRSGKS
jgi:hypothetical protein